MWWLIGLPFVIYGVYMIATSIYYGYKDPSIGSAVMIGTIIGIGITAGGLCLMAVLAILT